MAGRGRAPKSPSARRNAATPMRGEWTPAAGTGWQHGKVPEPPKDLTPASLLAWQRWFRAWFAAHWTPGDIPALNVLIGLYDEVERGRWQCAGELRMWCDTYGVTPKGQQDRRWQRPDAASVAAARPAPARIDSYAHLRQLGDDEPPTGA